MEIFPGFSSLQTVQEIQNDLRKRNIEAWKIHRRDHFYVNVQRHRVDKERKRWNLCFEFRKSRNTRRESRRDTGHFSVLETTRSGMELSLTHLKENEIPQPLKMVERFEDTGHPVFKSMSALSRGILKKKNGRDTIHFNADASNTELLFRISVFTEQFRIGVNNSAWQVKKRDKKSRQESVTKGALTSVKSQVVKLLVFSQRLAPKQFDSQGFAKAHPSCTGHQLERDSVLAPHHCPLFALQLLDLTHRWWSESEGPDIEEGDVHSLAAAAHIGIKLHSARYPDPAPFQLPDPRQPVRSHWPSHGSCRCSEQAPTSQRATSVHGSGCARSCGRRIRLVRWRKGTRKAEKNLWPKVHWQV